MTRKKGTPKNQQAQSLLFGTLPRSVGIGAIALLVVGMTWIWMVKKSQATDITVYKSPSCGCCRGWVTYLEGHGFTVDVEDVKDMDAVKKRLGVPPELSSCHTGKMGKYVVEGHVPIGDLRRLLRENPSVQGITVPGMPVGSPGMEVPGEKPERYDVLTYTKDGRTKVFARH